MAFMMPVMKNNYDIYKDSRSRKTSECSNASSTGGGGSASVSAAMGTPTGRSRKVSECKSESFATSPSHHHQAYRMQMQRCQSSRGFPRNSSRTSHSSAAGALSPTRSFCQAASSPPKTAQPMAGRSGNNGSSSNNNNNNNGSSTNNNHSAGSQGEFSKFHLRLVDKLRKSFRKDTAKRS